VAQCIRGVVCGREEEKGERGDRVENYSKLIMSYTIIENKKIEPHITFIRINPNDIALTLREVFESIANLSWINKFDDNYTRRSFSARAEKTINYIAENIIKATDDTITSESGEYVVSELARKSIVSELNYLDIPLAELIKSKKIGNPGFDFYSENNENIILFGEAKYLSNKSAYGSAFSQIVQFINEERHITDLVEIDKFYGEKALENVSDNNEQGFVAAFASRNTVSEVLINQIKKNRNYAKLSKHRELICVAVNIWIT